ncbi:MAG: hypothetical protein ABI379_12065 [Rhodanobacter sp.]
MSPDPPHGLSVLWQIGPRSTPATDPAHANTQRVAFAVDEHAGPRVTLEHAGFESHGEGAV